MADTVHEHGLGPAQPVQPSPPPLLETGPAAARYHTLLAKAMFDRLESTPWRQLIHQRADELTYMTQRIASGWLVLPEGTNAPTQAEERVIGRWVLQGMWREEWKLNGLQPTDPVSWRWMHEDPSDSAAATSAASPAPPTGSQQELMRRIQRLVHERSRQSSRPYEQFFCQVAVERSRILDKALYTGTRQGDNTGASRIDEHRLAVVDSHAYALVRARWTRQGIWYGPWGILPGLQWKHELPKSIVFKNDFTLQFHRRAALRELFTDMNRHREQFGPAAQVHRDGMLLASLTDNYDDDLDDHDIFFHADGNTNNTNNNASGASADAENRPPMPDPSPIVAHGPDTALSNAPAVGFSEAMPVPANDTSIEAAIPEAARAAPAPATPSQQPPLPTKKRTPLPTKRGLRPQKPAAAGPLPQAEKPEGAPLRRSKRTKTRTAKKQDGMA